MSHVASGAARPQSTSRPEDLENSVLMIKALFSVGSWVVTYFKCSENQEKP